MFVMKEYRSCIDYFMIFLMHIARDDSIVDSIDDYIVQ